MTLRPAAARRFLLLTVAATTALLGLGLVFAWLFGRLMDDHHRFAEFGSHLPTAVVALTPAVAAFLLSRLECPRLALASLLAALLPLSTLVLVENRWPAPELPAADAEERSLVHWNVEWSLAGWDRLLVDLKPRARDLIVLSEVPASTDLDALAQQLGPSFHPVRLSNMALFAQQRPEAVRRVADEFFLKLFEVEWGGELKLLVVDIVSAPAVSRWPMLERIAKAAEERRADLVVGDFNTPKVQLLRHLPQGFQDAYTCCGHGWSATWPMPLPVLALDHMLVGPRIRVQGYALVSSRWSDHRMQELRFSIAAPESRSLAQ